MFTRTACPIGLDSIQISALLPHPRPLGCPAMSRFRGLAQDQGWLSSVPKGLDLISLTKVGIAYSWCAMKFVTAPSDM